MVWMQCLLYIYLVIILYWRKVSFLGLNRTHVALGHTCCIVIDDSMEDATLCHGLYDQIT